MTYTETDLVGRIEHLAGADLAALDQGERDDFDQFHAGGTAAVERICSSLRLAPTMTVLDVGSGLGGPARQVARTSGCTVVGVDITSAYVDAARALTRSAGLLDRVSFTCGDIADLDRTDFDAAYTMHVQMNVADKLAFFSGTARRLRPGARFAVFEVCLRGDTQPTWPQPWSLDGTDSHLLHADELRAAIEASGFTTLEWVDETPWALQWFEEMGGRLAAGRGAATLPGLLDDGLARVLNFAAALAEGVLSIHRGAFVRDR